MAVRVAHRTATVDCPVYRAEQVDAIMRTDVTSMCCAPAEAVEPDVVLEPGAPAVEAAPDVLPAVEPGAELVAPLEPDELASMPVTSIS